MGVHSCTGLLSQINMDLELERSQCNCKRSRLVPSQLTVCKPTYSFSIYMCAIWRSMYTAHQLEPSTVYAYIKVQFGLLLV